MHLKKIREFHINFKIFIICNVYSKKITFDRLQLSTTFKDKTLFIHFSLYFPTSFLKVFLKNVKEEGVLIKARGGKLVESTQINPPSKIKK